MNEWLFQRIQKVLLIIAIIVSTACFCCGQEYKLLYTKQIPNSEERANGVLQKCNAYSSVEFVEFDFKRILDCDDFLLQFDGKQISIRKERIGVRDINSYVFVGSNIYGDRILISVLDDDIQGVIETDEAVYTIETVGEKEYALIQVDYADLIEACDNLQEYGFLYKDYNYNKNESLLSEIKSTTYSCKIRVLVLYTSLAQSSVSNIKNTILTAVELTNQSFVNSQIGYQIELVYAGLTNYSESNSISTDLERFRMSNDGYMDEVHSLRAKYSADVCVLLAQIQSYCGLASGIGVPRDSSFCLVSTYGTCATSNYSFGHEIGHLLGCRHDPYVDSNTIPFAYGHGYIDSSKSWRTIMAYGYGCNNCPRIQYWSNPNVLYGGVSMGSTTTHHNARVWNERSSFVMTFNQPENNVVISNNGILNAKYGDVISKQNIATNGTVNIVDDLSLNMRAGNEILLNNGFFASDGVDFQAKIDEICDCGIDVLELDKGRITIQEVPRQFCDNSNVSGELSEACVIDTQELSYEVFPNPTSNTINIVGCLEVNMDLSIEIVNLFGQCVKRVLPKQKCQAGNYNYHFQVSELPRGTYFLVISSDNTAKVEKIVIND